ncbi:MAG: AlpA family phage regulatory protein [Acidobacteria bacterium]|nr:AlpA family phage regulatory protein [Acidobacteriota bacterium]
MARELDRFASSLRIQATALPVEGESDSAGPLVVAGQELRGRPAPARLLRFAAVRARTGLSRSTIWRLERQGLFPRRRRISHGAVAWAAEEVEAWSQLATAAVDASWDQQ